jgi:hypothetical protein
MPNQAKFDVADLELLTSIIEEIPNLTAVAHATKLVRKRLKYPINKRDEILSLFDGKKAVLLGDRKFTVANVELFLLEKFFPIQSEQDLVRKLLIAFQIGDFYHADQIMRNTKLDDAPTEWLPGPAYDPGGYIRLGQSSKGEK